MSGYLEKEFHAPYHAWRADPSPAHTGAFLRAIDPVLTAALRSYAGDRHGPALHARAKLLALEAAQHYDPSRAKLRTHLLLRLQPLRGLAARAGQPIPLPERVALHRHRLHTAEEELRDWLGRDPSAAELSDHTGLSLRRIAHVRRAVPTYAEGQLQRGTTEEEPASPAILDGGADTVWRDFVYHDLGPVDQMILEHALGVHGARRLPKLQIARKLRLSPGAVSQRAARIQALLDQREELGGLL